MRRSTMRLAAGAVWMMASSAVAANPYLERAKVLVKQLRYPEAIRQLEVARAVPTLVRDEKLEILELLGTCLVAEGRGDEAERAFGEWLTLDPEASLPPQVSPKIREVFEAARLRVGPPAQVRLEEVDPTGVRPEFRLVDPLGQVDQVVLRVREPEGLWKEYIATREGDLARFAVPAFEGVREFSVEAHGPNDELLASLQPAARPGSGRVGPLQQHRQATATAGPARWLLAGVSVVAVSVGAVMQGLSFDSAQRARREEWVDSARALHSEAQRQATWATALFVSGGAAGLGAGLLFVW